MLGMKRGKCENIETESEWNKTIGCMTSEFAFLNCPGSALKFSLPEKSI